MVISIAPHPLLEVEFFAANLPHPLAEIGTPPHLLAALDAEAENLRDDETKGAVRRMLRLGGYRPAGRGKPASEFLVAASQKGILSSINVVVDACNASSLWGGLPISVVDFDRVTEPLKIEIAAEGSSYLFNRSGQEIQLTGLLCLFDAAGPCANAVKDSQRTKTHGETERVFAVVWGTRELPGRAVAVADRYREAIEAVGGQISPI